MSPNPLLLTLALALCIGVSADCTCDRHIYTKLRILPPVATLQNSFFAALGNGVDWNGNNVVALSAFFESEDNLNAISGGSKAADDLNNGAQLFPSPTNSLDVEGNSLVLAGETNDNNKMNMFTTQNKDGSIDIVINIRLVVSGPQCTADIAGVLAHVAPDNIEVLRAVEDVSVGKCKMMQSNQCPCMNGGSCRNWECSCVGYFFGRNCEARFGLRDVVRVAVEIQESCLTWNGFPFSVRDAMDASGFFNNPNIAYQCVETSQTSYFVIVSYLPRNSGASLVLPLSQWAQTTFTGYQTQVLSDTFAVALDCANKPGGLAIVDSCGQCNGDNACLTAMSLFSVSTPSPTLAASTPVSQSPAPVSSVSVSSGPVSSVSVSSGPVSSVSVSSVPVSSVSVSSAPVSSASVSQASVSNVPAATRTAPSASTSPSPNVYLSEGTQDSFSRTKLIVPVSGALLGAMVLAVALRSRVRRTRRASVARASPFVVATDMAPGSTIVVTVTAMSK